jgi:hypothetical protein
LQLAFSKIPCIKSQKFHFFCCFGQNVNANVFDQNRIGVLLGYRFNKHIRLEAGYLNQIVQFGRQINGQAVFQNNNGVIVNAIFAY